MTTRESFLASFQVKFPAHEKVDVPGIGEVLVKKLNAGEQDRFEIGNTKTEGREFRARMVVATTIDERGMHLFTDDDIPTLLQFDAETLDPIVVAALAVNPTFDREYRESLRKNSNGQAPTS